MYTKYHEFVAEFFGTMFIILFADGANALDILFNLDGYTNIVFASGIGVFLGILISNRMSGAHLNPAITLALVMTKRFPARKMFHYIVAQMLGGFVGAALVYYYFKTELVVVDPLLTHTANIFTVFPALPQFMPAFMSEIIATAILLFGILAIVEHFNSEKAGWLAPFAIGGLIVGIGMSFGGMDGYAMNVARDFSPRVFTALMGFQHNGLTDGSYVWLMVFGSLIGGPIGALLYNFTVGQKPTLYKTDKGNL